VAKIYNIVHTETGLTLRQYAKQHKVGVLVDKKTVEHDFSEDQLHYILSQAFHPGFYFYAGWEGSQLFWLPVTEFRVVWKPKALEVVSNE
jgi:hypothetical protein